MKHLKEEDQFLSRRDALKALVAAGGATALSTLPTTWEKPFVKVGALPAHAQTSPGQYPFTNEIESVEFEGDDGQLRVDQRPGWLIVAPDDYPWPWLITRPWLNIKRKWQVTEPPWKPVIKIKIKIKFFALPGFESNNVPADDTDFWCFGISGADLDAFLYYAVKVKIKENKVEFEFRLPAIESGSTPRGVAQQIPNLYPFYLSGIFPVTITLLNGSSLFPGYYVGPGCYGSHVASKFSSRLTA